MTYVYRLAEKRDGRACAKIIEDWSAETAWLSPPWEFDRLAAWWSGCLDGVETSWVAINQGKVVGFCVREDDNITGLYVARGHRGTGVGKGLFDLAKAGEDFVTVWAYEKNTRARKFYRREGCREISREREEGTGLIDVEHRWVGSS